MSYDYCVVGGGIVGLSVALSLSEREPSAQVVLVEKENAVGQHQTGHNSGVIHSGIYYLPGSLKARLCRAGCDETKQFARDNGISFDVCGKLLVATDGREMERMEALYQRSIDNDVEVERLSAAQLGKLEANISGVGALLIRAAGIIDYRQVCNAMMQKLRDRGVVFAMGEPVMAIHESDRDVTIRLAGERIVARRLVACAGLQSDRVAQMAGLNPDLRIVPFRGEYFRLPPGKSGIVDHLIYPIPDPELPFLGIHITRMIDGSVTVGPNAVLGFHREGYDSRFAFRLTDAASALSFPGLWRVLATHWRATLAEARNSLFRHHYLQQCRKFCPSLTLSDLLSYPPGIRAQAVARDGRLIHDFLYAETARMTHVLNAPSPAATAAIPIGRMIAAKILGEGSGDVVG